MTVVLHHQLTGPSDAPVLVLVGSLGTTLELWQPLVARLSRRWRVVAVDIRGHGGSPVATGRTNVGDLAGDVLALLDSLGVRRFGYCGLSLGGAIGQVIAALRPARVGALVLCCTSACFAAAAQSWQQRAHRVRAEGTGWLVEQSEGRWFTPGFTDRDPATVERLLAMIATTPAEGYAACCDALAEFDGRPLLPVITAPTLVIAGAHDQAIPVTASAQIVNGIAGAELAVVPDAAHLACAEQPEAVTGLIVAHLERHPW